MRSAAPTKAYLVLGQTINRLNATSIGTMIKLCRRWVPVSWQGLLGAGRARRATIAIGHLLVKKGHEFCDVVYAWLEGGGG